MEILSKYQNTTNQIATDFLSLFDNDDIERYNKEFSYFIDDYVSDCINDPDPALRELVAPLNANTTEAMTYKTQLITLLTDIYNSVKQCREMGKKHKLKDTEFYENYINVNFQDNNANYLFLEENINLLYNIIELMIM